MSLLIVEQPPMSSLSISTRVHLSCRHQQGPATFSSSQHMAAATESQGKSTDHLRDAVPILWVSECAESLKISSLNFALRQKAMCWRLHLICGDCCIPLRN